MNFFADLTPPTPAVTLGVTLGVWTLVSYFILRSSSDSEPMNICKRRITSSTSSEYFSATQKADIDKLGMHSGTEQGCSWSQTDGEITVRVPIPAGARGKDCMCQVLEDQLTITVKSSVVVKGKLFRRVKTEDSDWSIEDVDGERVLKLTLEKLTPTKGTLHWKTLLLSPEL